MRKGFTAIPLVLFLLVGCVAVEGVWAQSQNQPGNSLSMEGPQPITPAMEQKVNAMVHRLTLAQKLALIGGEDNMYIRAEPSIGLPRLKMSDGPMGVRTWGPSTAYAAGIGLAASWDTQLAYRIGVGLGQDARSRGVNFLLGPGVNIYRLPLDGRNFEFFGEDPYLSGKIAVGYIDGVQSQGVVATIKHFDANNSEYDRHNENAIIGERALREIYLPIFRMAVEQAHVGAVMDSYNLVNGEHATQNRYLNIQALRQDWGFRGILMSDWGATYDGVAAANGGLDLEMPSGKFMNAHTLVPAIQNGQVTKATIDLKVKHILQTAMRFGFFNREQLDPKIPSYNQHGAAIALQAAEEDAVLLKNRGHLLPLDRNAIHSIAMLGPDAWPAVPTAGGSAQVTAFAPVSFMNGMSNALSPNIKVYWNAGTIDPAEIFKNTQWCQDSACKKSGLQRAEYDNVTNASIGSGTDAGLNDGAVPQWCRVPGTQIRVEWTGYFVPRTSGVYYFVTDSGGGTHYRLLVNGKQILNIVTRDGGTMQQAKMTLAAGQSVKVRLLYLPSRTSSQPELGVIAADKLVNPDAVKLARMADVVVVSAGFSPKTESEGFDRSYYLPVGQEELIQAVAAANPKTIVVLTSGGSVATSDWLGNVPVLLQTWYAGQEAGVALPKILFGEVDPSGRLPISWPKTIQDNPAYAHYFEAPGTVNVEYSNGIFIGYRYFETSKVKPLFPFGFGLSYTKFAFSNLSVSPAITSPSGPITVAFDVKNTGPRAGAEVAQVYVGDPSATVKRPKMELKGFSRIQLAPGQVRHVTVMLDKHSLAYWDVTTHAWKVDPGKFIVYVGDSSENVPLQASCSVQ